VVRAAAETVAAAAAVRSGGPRLSNISAAAAAAEAGEISRAEGRQHYPDTAISMYNIRNK
jgi:hypothetical protein